MEQSKTSEIDQYQRLLDVVEAHINELTQVPLEERLASLSDIERAKFRTVLAYAMTTLQLCALRTKGESAEGQRKMNHLANLKAKFVKIDHYIDLASK